MAFSLFGKRDKPDQQPAPSAPEPVEQKRGLFDRMKQAVTRTRESLSYSISSVIALTREVDETTILNLEPILLAADLGAPTTALVMENLRQRALRTGIQGGDELKHLLKSELKQILDGVAPPIPRAATPPRVIMLVGVNGTGKTTTTGKLAFYFRSQGKTVLLAAADTFRAAAIEQLEVWGQRTGVEMIKIKQGGDALAVLFDGVRAAQARAIDVVVSDTAGRLHTKDNLMAELSRLRKTAGRTIPSAPHKVLLVMEH